MKVLFNTYPMAFDVPGGGERQLMAYYRYLPRYGIEPTLFNLWNPRFDGHDLVHFFSAISGSIHFCRYVKALGLPLVVSTNLWVTEGTKHDYPFEEIRDQLALADRIVVNADMEAVQLSQVYGVPHDRFKTIYNGVEHEFFESADPEMFVRSHDISAPFLLNVANVEPRKNQLALVRALKRFPALRLVIVGHVRDREYAAQCFSEAGHQMAFIGPLPYNSAQMRSAIAACEVFAMPSTLETPSIAALEAAAQGARVLVTEFGSTREYFGDAVVYVNPMSIDSIAEGIALARRQVKKGNLRALVRARYTWEHSAEALAVCYKGLASG